MKITDMIERLQQEKKAARFASLILALDVAISDLSDLEANTCLSKDGDMFCAFKPGFVNIQESICGFGKTPRLAIQDMIAAARGEKNANN